MTCIGKILQVSTAFDFVYNICAFTSLISISKELTKLGKISPKLYKGVENASNNGVKT